MSIGIKMMKSEKSKTSRKGGFTIVELLVSAVLMLIAVFAIVAVVRKTPELQELDYHRRQARTIIMRTFEENFDYISFPGPYHILDDDGQPDVLNIDDEITFTIDDNGGGAGVTPLKGYMNIKVDEITPTPTITVGTESVPVRTQRITIELRWWEVGADKTKEEEAEKITLTKYLSEARTDE